MRHHFILVCVSAIAIAGMRRLEADYLSAPRKGTPSPGSPPRGSPSRGSPSPVHRSPRSTPTSRASSPRQWAPSPPMMDPGQGKSNGSDSSKLLRRRSSGGAKELYGTGSASNQRAASPRNGLHDLRTIYEGPVGSHAEQMCHKTTLIVTNKTVEFEREGANCFLSFLTLGLWWFFFQTATIEIYELERVSAHR